MPGVSLAIRKTQLMQEESQTMESRPPNIISQPYFLFIFLERFASHCHIKVLPKPLLKIPVKSENSALQPSKINVKHPENTVQVYLKYKWIKVGAVGNLASHFLMTITIKTKIYYYRYWLSLSILIAAPVVAIKFK